MIRGLLLLLFLVLGACDSAKKEVERTIDDIRDVVDGPERREIDVSIMGVNAFVNDARFGGIREQLIDVRDTLGIRYLRILFNWNDQVQPTPESAPNFSFYDEIAAGIPEGMEALVILNGAPGWMINPENWREGNPRTTFVDRWVRPVVRRYRSNPRITAWQVWNEPNMMGEFDSELLELVESPENYVELLARAYSVIKDQGGNKLVVTAATTAINQNYSATLNYNRRMQAAGAESFADIWAIHYYGRQYENVIRPDGVKDFTRSLRLPLWLTESGAQGPNNQRAYVEEAWPYLVSELGNLQRTYYYQYADSAPVNNSYGLRTLDQDFPVSDLYIWLRDRPR